MEPQPAPAPVLATLSDGLLRTVEGTVIDAGPVRGEIEEDVQPVWRRRGKRGKDENCASLRKYSEHITS